jgi:hypothetical protein
MAIEKIALDQFLLKNTRFFFNVSILFNQSDACVEPFYQIWIG